MDVWVNDVNAKTNRFKDPAKVSAVHAREKKKKYLGACSGNVGNIYIEKQYM